MAWPKPLLIEFGIHHSLESCGVIQEMSCFSFRSSSKPWESIFVQALARCTWRKLKSSTARPSRHPCRRNGRVTRSSRTRPLLSLITSDSSTKDYPASKIHQTRWPFKKFEQSKLHTWQSGTGCESAQRISLEYILNLILWLRYSVVAKECPPI